MFGSLLFAAPPAEPDAGWGGFVALVLAAGAFWLLTAIHGRWRAEPKDHSPALPAAVTPVGVKPQISAGVDPVDPMPEPVGDPTVREWGRVDTSTGSTRVAVPVGPALAVGAAPADLDRFVAERLHTDRPAAIIREARTKFRRSEATVKRAIRRARGNGEAAA